MQETHTGAMLPAALFAAKPHENVQVGSFKYNHKDVFLITLTRAYTSDDVLPSWKSDCMLLFAFS